MRRFTARIAISLLAFLVGMSTSHLWRTVTQRHAPSESTAGYGVEVGRGKFIGRAGGIPGQYVVVLDDNVSRESVEAIAAELTRGHGGRVQFVYRSALKGFSVTEMPEGAAEAISRDLRVSYVESNILTKLQ